MWPPRKRAGQCKLVSARTTNPMRAVKRMKVEQIDGIRCVAGRRGVAFPNGKEAPWRASLRQRLLNLPG